MANDDKELLYAISYNQNAELSVTGAYLIDPHYLNRVAGTLQAEDFMNPLCAKLYTAATKAFREGKILDPVMARDVILHDTPNPDAFLVDCMNMCPSVSVAEDHAEYIHAQAKERRLRSRIDEALTSQSGDGLAVEIAGICQDYMSGKLGRSHTMSQMLNNLMDRLSLPPKGRVETGFTRVDALLKGMRAGNFVIIAARPAVGKSVYAQNIAMNVARSGKSVLLYSLEMSDEELGERIISKTSGVQLDKITDHNLDEQDWKRISDACQYLYDLPLIINDDPSVTTSKIRAEARMTENLGLIIVDFLTLIKSERKYDSRNLEVGAISRELKLLAKELKIPIIALSQLNRNAADTSRPTLAELRDSGELEQNTDSVIFLWNIDVEQGIKGVAVAKNRQGRCGAVQMRFIGDQMRFVEMRADEEVWSKTTPPRRRGKWEDDD